MPFTITIRIFTEKIRTVILKTKSPLFDRMHKTKYNLMPMLNICIALEQYFFLQPAYNIANNIVCIYLYYLNKWSYSQIKGGRMEDRVGAGWLPPGAIVAIDVLLSWLDFDERRGGAKKVIHTSTIEEEL